MFKNQPPSPTVYPRTIPTLMLGLLAAAIGFLVFGCDAESDQSAIRRDQLSSDIRSGRVDDDLSSEVRSKQGLNVSRFNSITMSVSPSSSGDITLTATDSLALPSGGTPMDLIHRVATVELADGVATCLETGEVLTNVEAVSASASNIVVFSRVASPTPLSMECELMGGISHEIGHIANKSPTLSWDSGRYNIYIGDVGN